MADYLTRVAEAVRNATLNKAWQIGNNGPLRSAVDLPAVIASVPKPDPVAWQPGIRPPSVFKTSDAGRQFVADYFASGLRRHDFSRYIKSRLAADFACALADGLHAMLAAAELVAVQPTVPDGLLTAADMKHLRRFAECAEDCDADGHDVPKEAMKRLERAGAVRSLGFGRHETTAFGDAMLAAATEAPQTIQCNACDWIGSSADALYLGGREPIGPLCPECHETTGPADDAATLRKQNAALVSALEGVLRWIDHWAQTGPGMDFERVEAAADAALASAKGGAA